MQSQNSHRSPRSSGLRGLTLLLAFAATLAAAGSANAQDKPKFKMAYAKCAHCLSMALVPGLAKNVDIEAINFTAGSDALTALVSKGVDIAQVTYLSFVSGLDKGFDLVAVSGQVNGGSEILVGKDTALAPDDWAGLKKLIAQYKAQGKPFRVAASRGNAQDLHMRGEMALNGINPNKDVQFINIPNPADHAAALQRGEVELICSVEPFASQIRMSGVGKHFSFPYKQAAGRLTNLIVTRSDVIKEHPAEVRETVAAVVRLVATLDNDKQAWVASIVKGTGLDKAVAAEAIKNAWPDYKMYRKPTLAIASMMKDLKYISTDVSAQVDKNMDYSFLMAATGKSKVELGY
ncbi:MAG: transporter substrate-binding protein [Herbaspirillum sp.]|jgi:ABC-type nitrate/sulfonate/bicarbonate transport system substrate-binding protein|nr:transporter substrate-binding protein [Herbaspirillum sp.]